VGSSDALKNSDILTPTTGSRFAQSARIVYGPAMRAARNRVLNALLLVDYEIERLPCPDKERRVLRSGVLDLLALVERVEADELDPGTVGYG